jgi:hypothetical protein
VAAVKHFLAVTARQIRRPLDDDHDHAQGGHGYAEQGQTDSRQFLGRTPRAGLQPDVRDRRKDVRQWDGCYHALWGVQSKEIIGRVPPGGLPD